MPQQYVAFTPEQFRALDDKLTEISQGGGGGGTIADGSVTTAKLADGAVTAEKADIGSLSDAVSEMQTETGGVRLKLIAADAMSQAAAQQLGGGSTEVPIMSPADLFDADTGTRWFIRDAVMLVFRNGTIIEGARLQFYANLDASNVVPYVYARGYSATASGILGVDDSWTIAAN